MKNGAQDDAADERRNDDSAPDLTAAPDQPGYTDSAADISMVTEAGTGDSIVHSDQGGAGGRPDAVYDAASGADGTGGAGGLGGSDAFNLGDANAGSGGMPGAGGVVSNGGRNGAGGVVSSGGSNASGGRASGGSGSGGLPGAGGSSADAKVVPPTKSILFVVGTIPPGNVDSAIQSRLVDDGYSVTLIEDANLGLNPTVSQDIVLISRSVSSSAIDKKFRTVAKSVMVWEPNLYADMGLVDGTSGSYGSTTTTATSVVVDSSQGPLTGGLSGTVAVFTSAQQLGYGVPNAQAIKVASVPGQSSHWTIFAYDTGVQMPGLVAPARRVGFFFTQTSPTYLNKDGWRLFDAAVGWLSGN